MPLTLAEFVNRWKINALSERSGSQSHFIDLCAILGEPHPAAADAIGERYTFEKPVSKVYGGKGFADVWLRDHFAWEYKGKHKDLGAAYRQINDYREELGNPPLLVVCDMNRFEVHTNFTNTNPPVYSFSLDDVLRNVVTATCPLPPLQVLRALFGDYNVLRPDRTDAFVTQEAAKKFAKLAERLFFSEALNQQKQESFVACAEVRRGSSSHTPKLLVWPSRADQVQEGSIDPSRHCQPASVPNTLVLCREASPRGTQYVGARNSRAPG